MKIVIFGLTISSSWGNGHATLWRGLCRALIARGHRVVFYERNAHYYAEHRDVEDLPGGRLVLYASWEEIAGAARRDLEDAEAAITTSYCTDSLSAGLLMQECRCLRVFYDLDTPVTLSRMDAGESIGYVGERGLSDFDLVLSYTGGVALDELKTRLGAVRVAPLYGSVDPTVHRPVPPVAAYRATLSYLGTYAEDRQKALEELFIEPARQRPSDRFVIGGAQYPQEFPWTDNIYFVRHLPPAEHAAFFCSSRVTLNVTRSAMAMMGYCPSGRLFEAAACGAPILSDAWAGLEEFFEPGEEIWLAKSSVEALAVLDLSDAELSRVGRAARERVLAEHTAAHRAEELEQILGEAVCLSEPP